MASSNEECITTTRSSSSFGEEMLDPQNSIHEAEEYYKEEDAVTRTKSDIAEMMEIHSDRDKSSMLDERENEPYDDDDDDDDEDSIPPPKYSVCAKVYARDNDGLVYESVVRRMMYGPQYHKQVQVGMSRSEQEADEEVKQNEEPEPGWHYFVHFNGWSVKFDRFVAEEDIFPINERMTTYAQKVKEEHAALRKSMVRKVKGKKQFQTIDGAEFLQAWRKRLDQINMEMNPQNENGEKDKVEAKTTSGSTADDDDDNNNNKKESAKPKKKLGEWTQSTLQKELSLRSKGLTHKRTSSEAGRISLPFALKKILVEQWEIICQCEMVTCTPAAVSVREALNKYIESKGVSVIRQASEVVKQEADVSIESDGPKVESSQPEITNIQRKEMDKSESKPTEEMNVEEKTAEKAVALTTDTSTNKVGGKIITDESENMKMSANGNTVDETDDPKARMDQEWIDMADGIALMFDEALPSRLLYKEELPQIQALDSAPDLSEKRYSDLFGCEFLLRLFVRLPPMIAEAAHIPEDEARTIVAKVNDFIRFMHKNQPALFSQSYRKLNELELKIQQKERKNAERKRKRVEESTPESTVAKA